MPLKEKMTVSLVVNSGGVRKFHFEEYVNLKLYSVDHHWESKTIHAIIAPGLCTKLLLGLSFLASHSIVIDYKDRTVIDKWCRKDLRKPNAIKPAPKPTVFEMQKNLPKRGKIRQNQMAMMNKLRRAPAFKTLRHIADRDGSTPETKSEQFCLAVKTQIVVLAHKDKLADLDKEFKNAFRDRFEDIPHTNRLSTNVYHRLTMKDAQAGITCQRYTTPRKYKDAWDTLIKEHLDAGRIRPSNSPYLSPAFMVPKADRTMLPRWVNDYRRINVNTVTNSYPLPRINDILADCVKGKIWGKIDMTNSFFQTRMHPDDIKYTVVMTPCGAFEWTVMPMGFKNAPSTHQRRMNDAL